MVKRFEPNLFNGIIDVPEIPLEWNTVWSFPERGSWATHSPKYRGNFAPQIPRNIIEMYTEKGDSVLDPMAGAGTTLIEAKLLVRNALGLDINPKAIELTKATPFANSSSPIIATSLEPSLSACLIWALRLFPE